MLGGMKAGKTGKNTPNIGSNTANTVHFQCTNFIPHKMCYKTVKCNLTRVECFYNSCPMGRISMDQRMVETKKPCHCEEEAIREVRL